MVNIKDWDIDNAGKLAHVYNELVTDVPHCYPVTALEFETELRSPKEETKKLLQEEFHADRVFVGEQNGQILGFAHVAMGGINIHGQRKAGGIIHFLTYQPGYRAIGQALLEECEQYLCGLGASQLWAFQVTCNYRFYHLGWGNLSDRMGHVYGLFLINGYETDDMEIFLEQRDYSATEPALPDDGMAIVVKQNPGRSILPGLRIETFRGRNLIALIESLSAGEFSQYSEAQECFFIEDFGILKENEKGKGWGRYLLLRMLWEMRKLGYKHTVLSCTWDNPRAMLLYTNYGYNVTDTVYGLVKDLSSPKREDKYV
jgi:GNAT superfamily N-acetyltransferase